MNQLPEASLSVVMPPQPGIAPTAEGPQPFSQEPAQVHSMQIMTPEQTHKQAVSNIRAHLKVLTGETHTVMPTTPESEIHVGDSIDEFYTRAVLGKGGVEPSKTFLNKLMARMQRKHPDANVTLKYKPN